MKRSISFAFIFLQILIFVNANGFYTIVAPGTLQSNYEYTVSVTLHNNPETSTVKVGIVGPNYNDTKTIEVEPSHTELIHFTIPSLASGDYKLETEGIKGLVFKNSTELNFKDEIPKVYIQTDKAVYKPGDLIQYRILALDENTRPAKIREALNVNIRDGAGNHIKQLRGIKFETGVFSGKFQLSEQPVLGNWILDVTSGKESKAIAEKKLEVAKYVLPKFSVEIEAPSDVAIQDGVIKMTVRSKYTYGKPVKGKATVTIQGSPRTETAEKSIDIDGKVHIEFDLVKDLKFDKTLSEPSYNHYSSYVYHPSLEVLAVVTEGYTGNQQNKTASINLEQSRYRISVLDLPSEMLVNQPFEIKGYIKKLDGSPVQDAKSYAKLTIKAYENYYSRNEEKKEENKDLVYESKVDESGMFVFKVTLPDEQYYGDVKIDFEEKDHRLSGVRAKLNKADENEDGKKEEESFGPLKVIMKTKEPRLGEDLEFDVKSDNSIPYFVYVVTGRGKMLKHEYVKVADNAKSHSIKIKPTIDMIPSAKIYAYYVKDADLQFHETSVTFKDEFENKIEITAPEQTKPGEEVTLNIKTDPKSFVGLLGVDQSVLLLKSGNDLDPKKIREDLDSYNTRTPYVRGYGTYPGEESGLVTLTNANYPYNTDAIVLASHVSPFAILIGGFPGIPGAPSSIGSDSRVEPIIRKDFLETWTYEIVESGVSHIAVLSGDFSGIPGPPMPWGAFERPWPTLPPSAIGSGLRVEPKVRKDFLETWIYENVESTDANGLAKLTKKIPDTITSWVVTGFSMNEKTGFAMADKSTMIKVFQPFFLSTNLPYSVKRGEVISIPIVVFNYMEKALDAEVTMENTDAEYDFTEATNDIEEAVLEEKQRTKRISIPSNSGQTVSFMIRPNKVGEVTLKIKATTPLAGDAIHQKLKVEPEGVTHFENQAVFVNLANKEPVKQTMKATIPKEAVLDSEYLEFSAVGDILGPTIKNIDKLVRMPYGCGEQNMVNFVPNILVLYYLEATKREMPSIAQKAKNYMESGYQRELTYKHKNGAYSAFGEGSSEANSWLTAYVARSFIQAKKYITIDPSVIDEALDFLVNTQDTDGHFPQKGKLFHPAHQNDVGFTSFTLLAFLEDEVYTMKYKEQVDKAVKYIADNVAKEEDLYALSLATVVLKKVKHPEVKKLMEKLEKSSKFENDLKWWSNTAKDHSNDIEVTSYILQSLVDDEEAGKLLPIIRWLVGQRNSLGGFDSTQDTVVGLQALIKFAEKYAASGDGKMAIEFEAHDDEGKDLTKGNFKVDKDNSLLLQTHVLPKSTRQVSLTATGEGSSLVQLSYRYNLASKDDKPSFTIKQTRKESAHPSQLLMNVCTEYQTKGDNKESNMAVMEIALPSGYTADSEGFDGIRQAKQVQRIDTKNSDTTIIIYFDSLMVGEQVCFDVTAEKSHAVAKQKPAAITVYDYYNTEERATVYYEVKSSLCDICEKDECGSGCSKKD